MFQFFRQFAVEKVPWRDMKMLLRGDELPQFAVSVVGTSDEGNQPPVLALAVKVLEQFVRFLPTPIFYASEFRHVNVVEIHRLANIERCKGLFSKFFA